jgi:hypothetical protein
MNRDCFVVGVFVGVLFCCFLMLVVPKPSVCEVVVGMHEGKEVHIRYGVVIEGE